MSTQEITKQQAFAKVSSPQEAADDAIEYKDSGGSFGGDSGTFYIQRIGQGTYLVKTKIGGGCECPEDGIAYSTDHMNAGESQVLSVANPEDGCVYNWSTTRGEIDNGEGGSTGTSVTYTAPETNINCGCNPVIYLWVEFMDFQLNKDVTWDPENGSCGSIAENLCDSLTITLNIFPLDNLAYIISERLGKACDIDWGLLCCNCCGYVAPCPPGPCTEGLCNLEIYGLTYYNCAMQEIEASCDKACAVGAGTCACIENLVLDGATDVRTEEMIAAGCCPSLL